MSRERRRGLIQDIQAKRNSRVISYVTGDRPRFYGSIEEDVVSVLHEHVLAIDPDARSKIDLFLYSRGGDADVPWSIVSMLREYCGKGSFSVLIPYRAHSAATVIALGADEIVMGKKAELGPIDITLTGPFNPTEEGSSQRLPISVEDVTGYFTLLDKVGCEGPEERLHAFEMLARSVHPLTLGHVSRMLEQTELVALRLLGTRAVPFSPDKNKEIVKRLSSEIYSHHHAIHRTEAAGYLGLEQVVKAEDVEIDEELWALYEEYRDLFSLETPFLPEEYLTLHELDEYTWSDLPTVCVESEYRVDIYRQDHKTKRLRQIPDQVHVMVNQVGLPAINMPALPKGMTAEKLAELVRVTMAELVEQILPKVVHDAAEEALKQLLQSVPTTGFEHSRFNSGWRTEVQDGRKGYHRARGPALSEHMAPPRKRRRLARGRQAETAG